MIVLAAYTDRATKDTLRFHVFGAAKLPPVFSRQTDF
jgi:hypothetical protein